MSAGTGSTATTNADAARIGALAVRLADLHYAYLAAIQLSRHRDAVSLMPPKEPGQLVPLRCVPYLDGDSKQRIDFLHYFRLAQDPDATGLFDRVFFMGSLLTLGDALQPHHYFDHAPELELIYHLRNGVAHGNRFTFTKGGKDRLARYPAHNRDTWLKTPVSYEVTLALAGREVLYDFVGPAELDRIFRCVGSYLENLGSGRPTRP